MMTPFLRVPAALLAVLVAAGPTAGQTIHYVDAAAEGANDGTSWADAFLDLQDALAAVQEGDEVWVAAGAYRPDRGTGDRAMSFALVSGVSVHGGFGGWETERDQRDPSANVTVLSGDLADDDGPDFANYDENSFHVVYGDDLGFATVLDGFTITGGNADDEDENDGGGIKLDSSDLTIADCVFRWNRASSGGAMVISSGRPRVIDCLFLENAASGGGAVLDSHYGSDFATFSRCVFEGNEATYVGGAILLLSGEPDPGCATRFTDCTFVGNAAATVGGAVSDWSGGGLVYINCVFSGNVAGDRGGAYYMSNGYQRSVLTNCTFSGNQAATGGGLYVLQRWPRFTNCVLWGNVDDSGAGESAQIHVPDGYARLNYSCVQGWTGVLFGEHTIDQDPRFADPAGPDGVVGTADDDLRLLPDSPCIDAGDNEVDTDLSTYEQDYLPNFDRDNGSRFSDYPPVEDTGNGVAPIVDIGAFEYQDCNTNGVPDPQDIADETSQDVDGNGIPDECQAVWFTDDSASGADDGTSWADGFVDLQDALDVAGFGDEVRVAAGVYRPDRGTGDRAASFGLRRGVRLYGGFAGPEAQRGQRDPTANATVLSGDLADNDGPDFANSEENSHHVVKSVGVDGLAVLDGFVITAGNAAWTRYVHRGGGLYNSNASPTIVSCAFHRNQASVGGAMYNDRGSPTLIGCVFGENQASSAGAFCNGGQAGESQFIDCTFSRNSAIGDGGAVVYAGRDGDGPEQARFVRCRFVANTAGRDGGGMRIAVRELSLLDCLFHGNVAAEGGGGLAVRGWDPAPAVLNCTFSGNRAATGGGIAVLIRGFPHLRNCILWGNRADVGTGESAQISLADGALTVNYSCVQGWTGDFGGTGNIGSPPLLKADGLHLMRQSPCKNAGDPSFIPFAGQTDLDGQPRVVDGCVDMGADEVLLELLLPDEPEPIHRPGPVGP